MFAAGGDAVVLQTANNGSAQFGGELRVIRERAITNHRIGGIGVDIQHRRVIEIDPDRSQLSGQRGSESFGKRLVLAATERHSRRPLSKRGLQPRDATALLVHADPERPLPRQRRDLARQFRDLPGLDDVPGEENDAAEIELGDQLAQIVRRGVTSESGNDDASCLTPKIAKGHARNIIEGQMGKGRGKNSSLLNTARPPTPAHV